MIAIMQLQFSDHFINIGLTISYSMHVATPTVFDKKPKLIGN